MQVLIANMKQFYQCRRLWAIYVFCGFFLYCAMRLVRLGRDASTVLVIVALSAGWVAAVIQEAVASRPFSFCLPNYRDGVRRFVFLVGAIVSVVDGLYFALKCHISVVSPEVFILIAFLGLCFAGTVYLIGAVLTFVLGSEGTVSIFLMVNLFMTGGFGLRWRFDDAVLSHSGLVILLGMLTSAVVWQWLGRSDRLRRRSARPGGDWLSVSLRPSEEQNRQAAAWGKVPEFPPALERRLLDVINSAQSASLRKRIVGSVYTTIGPVFLPVLKWKMGILWGGLLSAVVFMSGYEPMLSLVFSLAFLGIGGIGLPEGSPLFSRMLICDGRRERFYQAAVDVSVFAVLSAAILMLPVLLSILLAPWLPDLKIGSTTFMFHHIPFELPLLPMIVLPVLCLPGFFLRGRQGGRMVSLVIVGMALMILLLHLGHIPEVPVLFLVLIGILSWFVFVLCLHRIAMRSDLVGE